MLRTTDHAPSTPIVDTDHNLPADLRDLANVLDDDFFANELDSFDLEPSGTGSACVQAIKQEINALDYIRGFRCRRG